MTAMIIAAAFLIGFVLHNELTKPALSFPFDFDEFVRQLVAVCMGAGVVFVLERNWRKGA